MNQISMKIENALPQIMVASSVVVVVFLSLSISNSHIVHHPGNLMTIFQDSNKSMIYMFLIFKLQKTIKFLTF